MTTSPTLKPKISGKRTNSARLIRAGTEINEALDRAATQATSQQAFYRDAIRILASYFDAPFAAVHVDLTSGSINEVVNHRGAPDSPWEQISKNTSLDVRFRGRAVAKLFDATALNQKFTVLGVPIVDERIVGGALIVVTKCDSKQLAAARLRELQSLQGQMSLLVARAVPTHPKGASDATMDDVNSRREVRALAAAAKYETAKELAFAIANDVKSKIGCEQVSVGLVDDVHITVQAISGQDEINARSPGVRLIRDAMVECFDARQIITHQAEKSAVKRAATSNYFLHARWHQESGHTSVASIPLVHNEKVIAVVSLRHRNRKLFKSSELTAVQERIQPLCPGIALLQRASRSKWKSIFTDTKRMAWAIAWKGRGLAGLVALIFLGWFLFGSAYYQITVPCEITCQDIRHISSPLQATLARSKVQMGQIVKAQDVLAEFDVAELVAERDRILAELRIAELTFNQLLVEKDPSTSQQANEVKILESQLTLVESRIAKSVIRAPFDGVVLTGSPRKRIGEVIPIGEALLSLGKSNALRLELVAPESVAPFVDIGQKGCFIAQSSPEQEHAFVVNRIHHSSTIKDNQAVYLAEADIDGKPTGLRVGMTGYARIQTARKPIWWIASRKVMRYLRLQLWKL